MGRSNFPGTNGSRPLRVSFWMMAAMLVVVGWLHLAMPLLSILFSYLALSRLLLIRPRNRWLAVALFLVLLGIISYGLAYSINQAVRTLPEIAEKSIPSVIRLAQEHQVELPFTDYDSLKDLAFDAAKSQVHYLSSIANFARGATKQFLFLIVGVIIAIGYFLDARVDLDREKHAVRDNLYSLTLDELSLRFRTFFASFATVMGAQVVISAINTVATGIFVFSVRLPNPVVVIGLTFLCGLLPVVGNLISNTVIVAIGFTVSPRMALIALVFLVVIHKLEYFLNSKIVGDRIRSPIWLTLIALVLGEELMGVPGMILAPVVVNYIKRESVGFEVRADSSAAA